MEIKTEDLLQLINRFAQISFKEKMALTFPLPPIDYMQYTVDSFHHKYPEVP